MVWWPLVASSVAFLVPAVVAAVRRRRRDAAVLAAVATTSVLYHGTDWSWAKPVDMWFAHCVGARYALTLRGTPRAVGAAALIVYFTKSRGNPAPTWRVWHLLFHALAQASLVAHHKCHVKSGETSAAGAMVVVFFSLHLQPLQLHLARRAPYGGTETAIIEMAAALVADPGRRCAVVVLTNQHPNRTRIIDGIVYMRYDSNEAHAVLKSARALVVPDYCFGRNLWLQAVSTCVQRLPLNAHFVPWIHCAKTRAFIEETALQTACGRRLLPIAVSEFAARAAGGAPTVVVRNALPVAMRPPQGPLPEAQRKPGKWVFAACYQRGGAVVERAFAEVQRRGRADAASELHFASYYTGGGTTTTTTTTTAGIHRHGPLQKTQLSALLQDADVCVLPLVLEDTKVAHETFCLTALEALAHGVLVVTWAVAGLVEYGDLIEALPPPTCPDYDPQAADGRNPEMLTDAAVGALADAVVSLRDLPDDARFAKRAAGHAWAVAQTWDGRAEELLRLLGV